MKPDVNKWIFWAVLAASTFTISLSLKNTYLLSKIALFPEDYFNEVIKFEFKNNSLKRSHPTSDSVQLTKDILENEQLLCLPGESFFITIKNSKYVIGKIEKPLSRVNDGLVKLEEGVLEIRGSSLILRYIHKGLETQKKLEVLALGKKGQLIEFANYYGESLFNESCKESVINEASLYWKPPKAN